MRPRYITAVWSASQRITERLWEMNRYATPSSSRRFARSSRIWFCVETSRAETASSSTISFGLRAMARAMAMRWRCPPENSYGYRSVYFGDSPTCDSSSRTRSSRALPLMPSWTRSGSPTMSAITAEGSSEL